MPRDRIDNHLITIDGETKLLSDWAEEYGISVPLILGRIERGWDEEKAVTKPPRRYKGRNPDDKQDHSDGG